MPDMSVDQAVAQRRAIKGFDPEHKLTDSEFQHLMHNALLSPTAWNLQNWRFVRVTDPALRKSIQAAAHGQPQVVEASELLVLCFDQKAWEKQPQRYWQNAPEEVKNYLVPAIDQYYRGREQVQRDEGMRSCGIAAMTIMLSAKSMGYDSCPMDGFDFDAVAGLINLPADHAICMMLAIGKKVKEAWPRPGQLSLDEVLITNTF